MEQYMTELHYMGKVLVIIGMVVAGMGVFLWVTGGKIPWIGHLPGDISIKGKHVTFYFPAATCLLLSLILSLILYLFRGR